MKVIMSCSIHVHQKYKFQKLVLDFYFNRFHVFNQKYLSFIDQYLLMYFENHNQTNYLKYFDLTKNLCFTNLMTFYSLDLSFCLLDLGFLDFFILLNF